MNFQLEICCYNLQSCIIAEQAGANRIELCADPAAGGTTASFGTIKTVKEKLAIDVYPIIRPRGGDFFYDADEFTIMKKEILLCKELGCEGVVIGMLLPDGTIDATRCKQLVDLAYPLGVTFHRAFDRAANPFEALEMIIDTGCESILTSGQKPNATAGILLLNDLVRQADERIIIMPGSGVRSSNVIELAQKTGATEFHSSARILLDSKMEFINSAMNESLQQILADKNEIVLMKSMLQAHFADSSF
jgi:copper homeostasis protein